MLNVYIVKIYKHLLFLINFCVSHGTYGFEIDSNKFLYAKIAIRQETCFCILVTTFILPEMDSRTVQN